MKRKIALFLSLVLATLFGAHAYAGIQLTVSLAPPPIVVFDQPACPGDGYIWTPGYYQYGDYGYYWVPGQWVLPPSVGLLWTPGYWDFVHGRYTWHEGYWGSQVGFYGGINYGNGYSGTGFSGGRWDGKVFLHNTGRLPGGPHRRTQYLRGPHRGSGNQGSEPLVQRQRWNQG